MLVLYLEQLNFEAYTQAGNNQDPIHRQRRVINIHSLGVNLMDKFSEENHNINIGVPQPNYVHQVSSSTYHNIQRTCVWESFEVR